MNTISLQIEVLNMVKIYISRPYDLFFEKYCCYIFFKSILHCLPHVISINASYTQMTIYILLGLMFFVCFPFFGISFWCLVIQIGVGMLPHPSSSSTHNRPIYHLSNNNNNTGNININASYHHQQQQQRFGINANQQQQQQQQPFQQQQIVEQRRRPPLLLQVKTRENALMLQIIKT